MIIHRNLSKIKPKYFQPVHKETIDHFYNMLAVTINDNFKSRPERLQFIHLLYFRLSGLDLKFLFVFNTSWSVFGAGRVGKKVYCDSSSALRTDR